jgi:hypothetical protein
MSWTTEVYALIAHPTEAALLVTESEGRPSLPRFFADGQHEGFELNGPARLNEVVGQQLGVEARLLHNFRGGFDRKAERTWLVGAFVIPANGWRPGSGFHWAGRREVAELALEGAQRSWIESWLAERESGRIPGKRAPWARPEWLARATGWIERALAAMGRKMAAPPVVVKQWSISCVLRIPLAGGGTVYFKATLQPLFAKEPLITRAVAAAFPESVPAPLAINEAESWMLLPEFSGPTVAEVKSEHGTAALAAMARLQIGSAARLADWWAAGCLDRRLSSLPASLEGLLAGEIAAESIPADMLERVKAAAPAVDGLCRALALYAIPDSLVHGDFHGNNVVIQAGRPLIFDWTDGCVAHPFMDLAVWAGEAEFASGVPGEEISHYLACWEPFEPLDRLREAFALALPLGAVHQMVSYGYILADVEPETRWETAGGLRYFTGRFLEAMEYARGAQPGAASE